MAGEKEEADRNVVPLDEDAKEKKDKGLIEDNDRERLKNSPFGDLSDVAMGPTPTETSDPARDVGGPEPKKLGDERREPGGEPKGERGGADRGGASEPGHDPGSRQDRGRKKGLREAEKPEEVAMERYRSIKKELDALGEELGIGDEAEPTPARSGFTEEDIKERFKETNPQARIKKLDEFLGKSNSPNLPAPQVLKALNRQLKMVKKDYSEEEYAVAYGRIEALGEILTDIERYYSSG